MRDEQIQGSQETAFNAGIFTSYLYINQISATAITESIIAIFDLFNAMSRWRERMRSRVAFSGGRAQREGPRAQGPSGIPVRHCTAGPSGPDRLRWRPVFATSHIINSGEARERAR